MYITMCLRFKISNLNIIIMIENNNRPIVFNCDYLWAECEVTERRESADDKNHYNQVSRDDFEALQW